MPHTIITAGLLRSLGACHKHVDIFNAAWPAGLTLPTEESGIAAIAEQAAPLGLDFQWAAEALLTERGYRTNEEAIAPARRTYKEAIAPASRTYEEAIATASRTNEEAIATASRTYKEAIATARRTNEEAIATALRTYKEAIAPASRTNEEAIATARRAYEEARATELLRQLMLDAAQANTP